MNTNRRRILYLGFAASILAAAACAGLVMARAEMQQAQQFQENPPALPVETLPVRFQTAFEMQRVFSGRVQARRDSVLGFELGGQLARVLVREGAMVEKGALLAELDTERLEAQRGKLAAGLSEAQANLALAEVALKRLQGVVEAGGISHQGLDESREGQRAARAALELAQRRIATLDADTGLRPGDLVTLRLATAIAEPGVWLPLTPLAEGERGLWSVHVTEPV